MQEGQGQPVYRGVVKAVYDEFHSRTAVGFLIPHQRGEVRRLLAGLGLVFSVDIVVKPDLHAGRLGLGVVALKVGIGVIAAAPHARIYTMP